MSRPPISEYEWYRLAAPSGRDQLWVQIEAREKPHPGPWMLPDGTDVVDAIARGKVFDLPFDVWLQQSPSCRGRHAADMLWTGGLRYLVMSAELAAVLQAEAQGVRAFVLPLRLRGGETTDRYRVLVPDMDGRGPVCSEVIGHPSDRINVRGTVLKALQAAGVNGFVWESGQAPAPPLPWTE